VVRSKNRRAAVAIERYEFRKQGSTTFQGTAAPPVELRLF
jgi:hypothetical protein